MKDGGMVFVAAIALFRDRSGDTSFKHSRKIPKRHKQQYSEWVLYAVTWSGKLKTACWVSVTNEGRWDGLRGCDRIVSWQKRRYFVQTFTDPAIVLSMFMLSFIFVIVCGLFEWKQICAGLFYLFWNGKGENRQKWKGSSSLHQ
jgi:hypothetical protein